MCLVTRFSPALFHCRTIRGIGIPPPLQSASRRNGLRAGQVASPGKASQTALLAADVDGCAGSWHQGVEELGDVHRYADAAVRDRVRGHVRITVNRVGGIDEEH